MERRWSAELLESGDFDSLIVDNHVPDIYVGESLDRIVALRLQLRIILMQRKPAQHLRSHCPKLVTVVDKMRLGDIIAALANEHVDQLTGRSPSSHELDASRCRQVDASAPALALPAASTILTPI
jgi:hypothetical protein